MKFYIVGGWVRDYLRGEPSYDKDWVVVGANEAQMREAGFIALDAAFPVFLHPVTKQEYALARIERKVAKGYRGFDLHAEADVSLEEDLARRDLTINAMALDPLSQQIIDPFGGQKDWADQRLRHVSAAFADDPLRLIRLARFYATFPKSWIDPETLALCKEIVRRKELTSVARERIRLEIQKTYERSAVPLRFWQALFEMGAHSELFPSLNMTFLDQECVHECVQHTQPFLKGLFDLRAYFDMRDEKAFYDLFRFSQEEKKIWAFACDLSSLEASVDHLVHFVLRHRWLQNHSYFYKGYELAIDPVWDWDFLIRVREVLTQVDLSDLYSADIPDKKQRVYEIYKTALSSLL